MWLPLAISQGKIPGHRNIYKFGFNSAVGTTEETIWDFGELYIFPSDTGIEMALSSSSLNDESAGTGARTVEVFGLDEDFVEFNAVLTTDGQTAVALPGLCSRVFRAVVRSTGSGAVNDGTIFIADAAASLTAGVPPANQTFTTIGPTENQSLQAFFTIPRGHTGHLYNLQSSSFGNPNAFVTVRICFREVGGDLTIQDKFTVSRGQVVLEHAVPLFLPAMTDIECRATSSSGTVDCSVTFGLVVIQDGFEQAYLI